MARESARYIEKYGKIHDKGIKLVLYISFFRRSLETIVEIRNNVLSICVLPYK
jgi:hypothetical protein